MAKPKPPKPVKQEVSAAPEQDELGVAEPEEQEPPTLPGDDPGEDGEPGEPEQEPESAAGLEELYARATELKIKGRRKMSRSELIEAIALAEAEGSVPEVDEPGGPPEEPGAPQPVATTEQAQRIFSARTDQLQIAAADTEWCQKNPHLQILVAQELGRRAGAIAGKQAREAAQGPMERYVVTKGGRYVTRDGFPTHLPEGALVTPLTHDLRDVSRQGIEFRPATLVTVRLDEMGRQISEVR